MFTDVRFENVKSVVLGMELLWAGMIRIEGEGGQVWFVWYVSNMFNTGGPVTYTHCKICKNIASILVCSLLLCRCSPNIGQFSGIPENSDF